MVLGFSKNRIRVWLAIAFVILASYGRYRISENIADYFIKIEVAVFICAFALGRNNNKLINRFSICYYLFIVYRLCVGYLMYGNIVGEQKRFVYYEFGIAIIFALVVSVSNYDRILELIRNFGIIISFLALGEYMSKYNRFVKYLNPKCYFINTSQMGESSWRVRTIFFHPSIFAMFICVCWGIIIFYPYKDALINNLVKILFAISVLASNSRSGWVTFLIINCLILVEKWAKKNNYTTRGTIHVIGALFILGTIGGIIKADSVGNIVDRVLNRWSSSFSSNDISNYNRITMLNMGLSEWKKTGIVTKLFGFGPDYAIRLLRANPIRGWNRAVDNTYITILLNYGAIGLLLFVIILFGALYVFFKSGNRRVKTAAIMCIALYSSYFFFDEFSWLTCIILYNFAVLGFKERTGELIEQSRNSDSEL